MPYVSHKNAKVFFFLLRFAELQLVIEPIYGLIHARQVLDHATRLTRKNDLKNTLVSYLIWESHSILNSEENI